MILCACIGCALHLTVRSTGYEKLPDGTYSNEKVFPKWREKYPEPPDVIGVQRNYTYEIDRPSQKANQALVASIPQDHKQVCSCSYARTHARARAHTHTIRSSYPALVMCWPSRSVVCACVCVTWRVRAQGIKIKLRPLGFTGFKLDELTPNKTRRAQCVNWLLFYRCVSVYADC